MLSSYIGGKLLNCSRVGWVRVYRSSQVRNFQAVFHRHNQFSNRLSSPSVDDCRPEKATIVSCNQFNESVAVVFADRAVAASHFPPEDANISGELRPGLLLGDPSVRDLGISKCHPGNQVDQARAAAGEQRITGRLKSLPPCEMSELIATGYVACSVDVLHVCAKARVDRDAFLGARDTDPLKIQPGDSRLPSSSDEQ